MCEIVEYASIRLMLVCAIAAKLPIAIDSTDMITSICCQSPARSISPFTSIRIIIANAASFGAAPMKSVIAFGAPSYTSGIHMWNGTTPSLNARPATTKTRPNTSTTLFALPAAIVCAICTMLSVPVAP